MVPSHRHGREGIAAGLPRRSNQQPMHTIRKLSLTERRLVQPAGACQGGAAQAGVNLLNGEPLAPKAELELSAGDRLRIETPGGGGYGKA